MRGKRLWIGIVVFISSIFIYFIVLPDAFKLPSLPILPLSRISPCINTTNTVTNGCVDVVYGNYCVLSLPGDAERDQTNLGSVTLCTQSTVEYLHHMSVLCRRWGGPISVAVYSPAADYPVAQTLVDTLRHCDFCVRHWVSWHFFGRQTSDIFAGIPDSPTHLVPGDCRTISQDIRTATRKSEGPYPINIGRNVARQRALTPYVFSMDIELYPSAGVLPKFERMLHSYGNATEGDPQVWVLPVFEVRSNFSAPVTKFLLKQMYTKRQAISFHKYRCNACHMIPNLTQWLNHESQFKSEVDDSLEEMKVWMTVKRSRKYRLMYWEPFFIGTKRDPEFDIRLSWEGKQNKMQMAYEMCLRNYNFNIVDNAFLVHAPGINVYNAFKDRHRQKYMEENNKWISIIKRKLKKTYGINKEC